MWDQVGPLHAHHRDVPVEIRLLKLTEEAGVIITAAVAMSGIADGAEEARGHFERRLAAVTERAGL
jgi:hypothetical protein